MEKLYCDTEAVKMSRKLRPDPLDYWAWATWDPQWSVGTVLKHFPG